MVCTGCDVGQLVGVVCGVMAMLVAGGRAVSFALVVAVAMLRGLLFCQGRMRGAFQSIRAKGRGEGGEDEACRHCCDRQLPKGGMHK